MQNDRRWCPAALAALVAISATPAATASITIDDAALEATVNGRMGLADSRIMHLDVRGRPGIVFSTEVDIDGERFTLDLAPHSVRTDDYKVYAYDANNRRVEVAPGPVNTFRGTVRERPGTIVAAALTENGLHAMIALGAEEGHWWIEPIARRVDFDAPGLHAVYHDSETLPRNGTCGNDAVAVDEQLEEDPGLPGPLPFGASGLCTAQLGCDADFEYFQDYGSVANTEARINTVINAVNVQWEDEVSITHAISGIVVRSNPSDPYTTNDAGGLLNQFAAEWNSNQGSIQRDLAHLFTGRNLAGSTIGLAATGTVCFTNSAYSLVESDCCGSFACTTDLSSHELGHNWNALHCTCSSFTMNASLTACNNQFTGTTISTIVAFRNSRPCLDCIPALDYCDSTATLFGNNFINSVSLNTILNPSGGSGYADFTGISTELVAGNQYTLTVATTGAGAVVGGAWYDRTNDNDFEDFFETIEQNWSGNGTFQTTFNVISGFFGPTRLRIRIQRADFDPVLSECGNVFIGETEDYSITLISSEEAGACCLPDDTCVEVTEGFCGTLAGSYTVSDTTCAGVVCPLPVLCPEDFNGDDSVGFSDLNQLLGVWGPCVGCPEDLNGDDSVGFADLNQLLAVWGPC